MLLTVPQWFYVNLKNSLGTMNRLTSEQQYNEVLLENVSMLKNSITTVYFKNHKQMQRQIWNLNRNLTKI